MDHGKLEISATTRERAESAKAYIEQKYSRLKEEESKKRAKWEELKQRMEDMRLSTVEQDLIKKEILHQEARKMRRNRQRISVRDFESLSIIGKGAYGEVRLCRVRETGELVAMKKMKKSEMKYKNQVKHVKAERDVLARANNPWIVELKYSFQDEVYLYLCMEYLPGGDLMTLLMKRDIFTEDEARFYIAEMILAVDSAHKLNYIHRDLKPDNILLDVNGHIKLSDFGLCKFAEIVPSSIQLRRSSKDPDIPPPSLVTVSTEIRGFRKRELAYSTVGTPDYIAPEVFTNDGYNESVDWWSVGVILFEMLVGYPPFYSEDPTITCQKIIHWKRTLKIPQESKISPEAADLILKLIRDPYDRLGANGVEEIKSHPFFEDLDWDNVRSLEAPYKPEIRGEADTRNFDKFDEEEPFYPPEEVNLSSCKRRKDTDFIGYTFKKDAQRDHIVSAIQELEIIRKSSSRAVTFMQSKLWESISEMSESSEGVSIYR